MAAKITERRLVDVLVSHLRCEFEVRREAAHYEKRIDVLTYCPLSKTFAGFEAKTRNWQRAMQQAMLNLTAVDYSYIAIWSEAVHRVDRDWLDELGIGMCSVGTKWGDVEMLVEARKSPYTNRFIREHFETWIVT